MRMLLNLTLTTLNSTLCGLFRPDYPKRILQSRPRHEKGFLEFPHFLHFYAFDISTAYKKVDRENIKVLALNVLLKQLDVTKKCLFLSMQENLFIFSLT